MGTGAGIKSSWISSVGLSNGVNYIDDCTDTCAVPYKEYGSAYDEGWMDDLRTDH